MPARHVLLAAAVMLFWGINFVVIDVGLESWPPLLFAALRFALVALPAVFFIPRPDTGWRDVVLVGTFLSFGQFSLLFVGMDEGMPAGLASLVLQLQAAFTAMFAVGLLGERLKPGQVAGALVAFAGIAVIAAGRSEGVPLIGVALTVGAAASWGLGNVFTRRAQATNAVSLVVWSSLVPPVPLALLSLQFDGTAAIGDAFASIGAGGLLALAYIVVISTFFGYGTWSWLLKRHPASSVAPFTLLVPVVGIVSAWIALGEQPNGAEWAGAAVVLAGLALTMRAIRPPRRVEVALT